MTRSPQIGQLPRRQRGAVVIWFALLLPVLLGFVALAVDLGRLGMIKAELQNAVDAAALGGALSLSVPGGDPYNWSAATVAAEDFARRNSANAARIRDVVVETGYWNLPDPSIGFRDTLTAIVAGDLPAVRATVAVTSTSNNGPVQFFFAPFLGIDESDVQASATAVLPAAGGGSGFFPWAIGRCMISDFWDFDTNRALKDENGDPLVMDVAIESIYHDDCVSGTWTTFWDQDNSVPTVRDLIDNGNPIPLSIGDSTWIQTGVKDALFHYVEENCVNSVVPVLVVDNVVPNSYQTIVAIAAFVIDDVVKINGKSHVIGHLSDTERFPLTHPGTGTPTGAYSPPVLVR